MHADDFNCTIDGFDTQGNCVVPSGGVGSRTDTSVYTGLVGELGGNQGLGCSFSFRSLVATAAIQLPYLRAGTDFLINDKQFKPYVELNTLSKPKRVSSACSRGSLLAWPAETDGYAWNSGDYTESDLFLNGNTCYTDLGPNEGGPG